jgi:hypothetical protein
MRFHFGRLCFCALGLILGAFSAIAEPSFMLADFDKEAATSVGGEITARQRVPSSVKWALDSEQNVRGAAGNSLRIEYIRLRGGDECLVILRIPGVDASAYNSLTFWVKGGEGGEIFDVALRDAEKDRLERIPEATFPIEKALVGGITTEWQKAVIPLEELRKGGERPASLLIVFNRITKFSTIHVDDFQFETVEAAAPAQKQH